MDVKDFATALAFLFIQFVLSQPQPSVLETDEEISSVLSNYVKKDEKLALLLDYDGVLNTIAKNTTQSPIDLDSQAILRELAKKPNVRAVIISGRGLNDLRNRVGVDGIGYSGNHGFEILYANKILYTYPISQELKDIYPKLINNLRKKLAKNGAWVEDKIISLTFHYAEVPEEFRESYIQQAKDIVAAHGYETYSGYNLLEAKPPIHWTKGNASDLILNQNYGDEWRENGVKVMYIGDDVSDEHAMRTLKGNAILFRISNDTSVDTFADYIIPSRKSVPDILGWINTNI